MRDTELQLVDELYELERSRNWRDAAACRDEDPELFFPMGQGAEYRLQVAEAKSVCADCPVRARCLQDALDRGEPFGVFGGLDEDERRAVKRRSSKNRPEVDLVDDDVDEVVVEQCLQGRPVTVGRGEKRGVARRVYAAGMTKTAISRRLRASGASVNAFLNDDGRAVS